MTPLELTYHQARAERLGRFKAAADALMQRQVKQLTDKFDAQDARNAKLTIMSRFPTLPPVRRKMICREVRHKHGFTWEEMIGASHIPKLCTARFEAWTRLRNETGMDYPAIGRLFNRHHATIIHGVEVWQKRNINA